MTYSKIFVIAEKLFVAEDNNIKSIINSIYKKRLENFLNSLNSDHIEVISNIKNIISKNSINQISLDQEAYKYKNNFDFKIIHSFMSKIMNIIEKTKLKDALIYNDIHILKILEPRILDQLFNGILWKLDFYGDRLKDKPNEIFLFDLTLLQRTVKKLIKQSGLRYKVADYWVSFLILFLKLTKALIKNKKLKYDDKWLGKSKDFKLENWNKKKEKKRILIIGTIDRTAVRVLDLAPELIHQNFDIYFLALDRISLKKELEKVGVNFAFAGDFILKKDNYSKVNYKIILEQQIIKNKNKFIYKNLNFENEFYNIIINILEEYKFRAFDTINIADNVLKISSPDVILSFEENELPRAFNFLSKKKNIEVVNAIHLSPAWYPGLIKREYNNIFVSGIILKKLFHPWNKNSKISIVGDPIYSNFKKKSEKFNLKRFINYYSIPEKNGLVGLFSTWPDDSYVNINEIKKLFCQADKIAKKFNKTLLIRPHPMQEISLIKKWLRDWKCEGIIINKSDILEFSMASEIIFLTSTTAVWYPMLCNTPVVTFQKITKDLDESIYGLGYNQNKGVFFVDDIEKKQNQIKNLFYKNSNFRKKLLAKANNHFKEHIGIIDKSSSKIFVSKINKLVLKNN